MHTIIIPCICHFHFTINKLLTQVSHGFTPWSEWNSNIQGKSNLIKITYSDVNIRPLIIQTSWAWNHHRSYLPKNYLLSLFGQTLLFSWDWTNWKWEKSRRYFCVDSIFKVDLLLSHHHSTQKQNLIKVSIGSTTSKLKLGPETSSHTGHLTNSASAEVEKQVNKQQLQAMAVLTHQVPGKLQTTVTNKILSHKDNNATFFHHWVW